MNSETIKGRLSQHVKRRLQSQESIESKISPHPSQHSTTVIANQAIIKEEVTENTSLVKSVKKRKIAKKSSQNSVESSLDDEDKCDKRNEKHDTNSLDILTLILNYKKSEFLRNPQISELLCEINKKKSNLLPELMQNVQN